MEKLKEPCIAVREEGQQSREICATPETLFDAVADFASYPVWTGNVDEVEILGYDKTGRADIARYTSRALGFTARYTLKYEFHRPDEMSWILTDGSLRGPLVRATIRHLDGFYRFEEIDEHATRAIYRVSAELSIPLGPIRKRAEQVIITSALNELQEYVES